MAEVHKHPQTNSRNYRPVPLTSHCPHRKARYGNDWSYCTCSYKLACNCFKMDAENLKIKFHGAWRFKNDFCDRHKTFGCLTCRTKLLEVVSEEVLPSERLKRLFLFAYFPWNMREKEIRKERTLFCMHAHSLTHTHTKMWILGPVSVSRYDYP